MHIGRFRLFTVGEIFQVFFSKRDTLIGWVPKRIEVNGNFSSEKGI